MIQDPIVFPNQKNYDSTFHLCIRFFVDMRFLWRVWVGLFLLMILTSVFAIAIPLIVKNIIDNGVIQKNQELLFKMTGVLIGIYFLQLLTGAFKAYLQIWVGQRAVLRLRMMLFRHLMKLRPRFYDKHPSGELISRLEGDVNTVEFLSSTLLIGILYELLVGGYSLIMMGCLEWRLFLSVLLIVPILLFIQMVYGKRVRNKALNLRVAAAEMLAVLQENVAGIRWIQNLAGENRAALRYFRKGREVLKQNLSLTRISVFSSSLIGLNGLVTTVVSYGFGGYFVIEGAITVGTLIAFNSYLEKMYKSITIISSYWIEAQRGVACLQRIYWLLDQKTKEQHSGLRKEKINGDIEFRNLLFNYNEEPPLLRDINFKIPAGQMTALVGMSGSGKSTLVNLLLKHEDAKEGYILIDGIPLQEWSVSFIRKRIGVVSQEQFFFFSSLRDNLSFVNPNITDEKILEILNEVGLSEWVHALPQKLDTVIGERGIQLSGGQRQRLALARVLIQDPDVIVLDEATSFLDNLSEKYIQDLIRNKLGNKTFFVIAHKLSTIQDADQIVVIDQGRITETGTHFELLNHNGLYQQLWNAQRKIEVPDKPYPLASSLTI